MALRDPVHGDLLLDIPTILAHVATIHGNVSAEDLLVWKAALLEKLSSPTDFLKHAALFTERYQKVHLEEPIAPSALFGIFESTFSHHPAFSPSLGRFYETTPDRRRHTVAALVAHITPSLPYIQKLSSPSHAAFGALGFPSPPIVAPAVAPPVLPLKHQLWYDNHYLWNGYCMLSHLHNITYATPRQYDQSGQ